MRVLAFIPLIFFLLTIDGECQVHDRDTSKVTSHSIGVSFGVGKMGQTRSFLGYDLRIDYGVLNDGNSSGWGTKRTFRLIRYDPIILDQPNKLILAGSANLVGFLVIKHWRWKSFNVAIESGPEVGFGNQRIHHSDFASGSNVYSTSEVYPRKYMGGIGYSATIEKEVSRQMRINFALDGLTYYFFGHSIPLDFKGKPITGVRTFVCLRCGVVYMIHKNQQ